MRPNNVIASVAACLAALAQAALAQAALAQAAPVDTPTIVLPARLPAACIQLSADDFGIPASVLLAMIKVESNGRSVVSRNTNGTLDIGVAQHNSGSWVPYLQRHYGITAQMLVKDVCQSVRAQAYVLRREMATRHCAGADLWCAVARYHSPRNKVAQDRYLAKVRLAMAGMLREGRFDFERVAR